MLTIFFDFFGCWPLKIHCEYSLLLLPHGIWCDLLMLSLTWMLRRNAYTWNQYSFWKCSLKVLSKIEWMLIFFCFVLLVRVEMSRPLFMFSVYVCHLIILLAVFAAIHNKPTKNHIHIEAALFFHFLFVSFCMLYMYLI